MCDVAHCGMVPESTTEPSISGKRRNVPTNNSIFWHVKLMPGGLTNGKMIQHLKASLLNKSSLVRSIAMIDRGSGYWD